MVALEVIEIEDGLGVVLPAQVLAHMQVAAGDVVYMTETERSLVLRSEPVGKDADSTEQAGQPD